VKCIFVAQQNHQWSSGSLILVPALLNSILLIAQPCNLLKHKKLQDSWNGKLRNKTVHNIVQFRSPEESIPGDISTDVKKLQNGSPSYEHGNKSLWSRGREYLNGWPVSQQLLLHYLTWNKFQMLRLRKNMHTISNLYDWSLKSITNAWKNSIWKSSKWFAIDTKCNTK
jgi:hypothetical protein